MSDQVGPVHYAADEQRLGAMDLSAREYSDHTAEVIDAEVTQLISSAYERTRRLLLDNRDKLEAMAGALLKYETLSADDVQRIIEGKALDKPTMDELLEAEHAKTPQPNRPGSTIAPPATEPPSGALPEPG